MIVLSLFPGIGLLDMAFEEAGFCVVRGPDPLWGGDIHKFNAMPGRFDGVIGGPPCQAHSSYAGINKARGNKIAADLVPEFSRVVMQAQPAWWLMENVPAVQTLDLAGYVTHRVEIDNRWLGQEQARRRAFQFGTRDGSKLVVPLATFDNAGFEPTCMASEGKAGRISRSTVNGERRAVYNPRRGFGRFCELQGLPNDFLDGAPFTMTEKYRVVGNGVPLPMGRAVAQAVINAVGVPA